MRIVVDHSLSVYLDSRLSLAAKGLYAQVEALSFARKRVLDEVVTYDYGEKTMTFVFDLTVAELIPGHRRLVMAALRELEAFGYVERHRGVRASGKMASYEYTFSESPQAPNVTVVKEKRHSTALQPQAPNVTVAPQAPNAFVVQNALQPQAPNVTVVTDTLYNIDKNIIRERDTHTRTRETFVSPSAEDVKAFVDGLVAETPERYAPIDAENFCDHYENVGWTIGKTNKVMKDWRLAARRWSRDERAEHPYTPEVQTRSKTCPKPPAFIRTNR